MLLRQHQIPTTFLTATYGEVGKNNGHYSSPEEMRRIREQEYLNATTALHVEREMLDLGDFWLEERSYREKMVPVLEVIRRLAPSVIFTFDPFDLMPQFYHPDHNSIGKTVLDAASAMDIPSRYPESGTATDFRSETYVLTTRKNEATHRVPISPADRASLAWYLTNFYPSQFDRKDRATWEEYFDRIEGGESGRGYEHLLIRVRE
jgi:LmbE family N-acetylglucosaminyl deacetylase